MNTCKASDGRWTLCGPGARSAARGFGLALALALASAASPALAETDSAEASAKPWYDRFTWFGFVDAYYSVNYRFPRPDNNAAGGVRAFDQDNGFSLSWAGLDVSYPAEPVGGTVSLRFGPTAQRYALADAGRDMGLEFIKQAFATWKPFSRLTLDFGKFGTPFGAEVAESWLDYNYTRGVLNWAGQPFFHAGLRASLAITPELTATLLAVNGWDSTIDNNTGKSFGLQLGYTHERFSALLGGMLGPEGADTAESVDPITGDVTAVKVPGANKHLRYLGDLVLTAAVTSKLGLIFNGDLGYEDLGGNASSTWYGASLMGRFQATDEWAVALRGEYFGDPDGFRLGVNDQTIITGTVTVDFAPSPYLLIRMDNRMDWADKGIFADSINRDAKTQFTTTLGVVVKTS